MMPRFWEYLITTCNGAAVWVVAEADRDSAEKQFENDPHLLSYRARPQTEVPVTHRPNSRILRCLVRLRTHKLEVIHVYDSVVTINNTDWPAYRKPNGTLVDLRMFDPTNRSHKPRLIFRPEKLRELGIPAALIDAAAQSDPQGLILFENLPDSAAQSEGAAVQPTSEQSTT
jgi:hypothetical protein